MYDILYMLFNEREVILTMDSDAGDSNAELTVINNIYEAYLRICFNVRRRAFLSLKKVII